MTPAVVAGLERVASRLGIQATVDVGLVPAVLRQVGGLPFAAGEWSEAHRSAVAEKLLSEATGALLVRGYGLHAGEQVVYPLEGDKPSEAKLVARLDPNRASLGALADSPMIGPGLARKIVADRRRLGPFRSLRDLEQRVSGLGPAGAARLRHVLEFPKTRGRDGFESGELDGRLAAAVAVAGFKSLDELLEELSVFCAGDPHPATRMALKRGDLEPSTGRPAEEPARGTAKILADRSYETCVRDALAAATSTIDICMFFMALGGPEHGTRALLDALIERSRSGTRVRVLLDRDDSDDPYGSRIINVNAARYLGQSGVPVHVDEPTRLLHSKFILIDGAQLIIGSHNWTTGSYRDYRDFSFEIRGRAAGLFTGRFEELWARSTPFAQ